MKREKFGSRLGFILISAGCAIGLGNVWRFPYITGQYGGAAFVLIYLLCLVLLGLPIMVMEFAVGRGAGCSIAMAFDKLEPLGTKWHWYKWIGMAGNYLLMMFYTIIGGWLLIYLYKMAAGSFEGMNAAQIEGEFGKLMGQPVLMTVFMAVVVILCFGIVRLGLQKGVEGITKIMMVLLLALLIILAVRAIMLPGAEAGMLEVVAAAMSQSFFTLSLGIGAMAIFGSYIDKKRRLAGEAVAITVLDTSVALISGLIIFPASFAFGVNPDSGPNLIFITLPNIFNSMAGGRLWGAIFFLCMFFASASTIIAVFENIIAFAMDLTGCSRGKAVAGNLVAILLLSMPCVLGYNVLSGFAPFGEGTAILDLEDFIVSNNILPIGSLVYVLFCTTRYGWGWKNFLSEANAGEGPKFPRWVRPYVTFVIPLIIIFLFIQGYWSKFAA